MKWTNLVFSAKSSKDRVQTRCVRATAGVYGVKLPGPRYDPNCDIDGDVDIFDLVIAAGNHGKKLVARFNSRSDFLRTFSDYLQKAQTPRFS